MEHDTALKDIESRTFRQSQQDGLLELVMGACMVGMSSRIFSPILVGMLALPSILMIRNSPAGRPRLLLLAPVAWVVNSVIIFAAIPFLAALRSASSTSYAFTLLLLVSGIAGVAFTMRGYDPGWVCAFQLWVLAVILTPVGVAQILCFLRRYPKLSKEAMDGR